MSSPSISVIIPTFNRAQLLPRAVESVLSQDWRPLELVIVDDGSIDDTPQVIGRLQPQAGVEIKALRLANGGDAAARNAGFLASGGDWIAFLDDDDTRRPNSLSAQMAAMGQAQAGCGLVAQGDRTKPLNAEKLLCGDCAGAFLRGEASAAITSLLVRRDMFEATGEFDTSLPVGSDMEWIARLVHRADFAALPQVVADYNFSETALSRYRGIEQLIERDAHDLRVVELARERCHQCERFHAAPWAVFAARVYGRCADHLLYAGRVDEAAKLLETGLDKGADADQIRRARRKLRKAKLLALVGRRLPHPKFPDLADLHG